jgi:hypothetical protein
MNDTANGVDQTEEEILTVEIPDEALEAAAGRIKDTAGAICSGVAAAFSSRSAIWCVDLSSYEGRSLNRRSTHLNGRCATHPST